MQSADAASDEPVKGVGPPDRGLDHDNGGKTRLPWAVYHANVQGSNCLSAIHPKPTSSSR